MADHNSNHLALPVDFNNVVRLFPLGSLVLFPGVVQALHIFEPRYRQLVEDAIASDELITMAMSDPLAAGADGPRPELLSTVCIGKIVSHNQFDDGRYNLLLVGSTRAKIIEEIVTEKPYRMAKVELIFDALTYAPDDTLALRDQVVQLFRDLTKKRGLTEVESLSRLFEGNLPLVQVVDLVCYACGAELLQQQRVLEEPEVCRRAEILIGILQHLLQGKGLKKESSSVFPPGFSEN